MFKPKHNVCGSRGWERIVSNYKRLISTKTSAKFYRAEAWTLVCRETKLNLIKRVDHTNSIINPPRACGLMIEKIDMV